VRAEKYNVKLSGLTDQIVRTVQDISNKHAGINFFLT